MDVAILFSGGKDSTFAIQSAIQKGWNVKYLISVKPTRKDCFLFHYATVEHTKEIAKMLNIPHFPVKCRVAEPMQEAALVGKVVEDNQNTMKIDAVVLGGTGLQETQLRSIQKIMKPLGVEAFAAHAGEDHDLVFQSMIEQGYQIMVTQIASDGLKNWLGKIINRDNFAQLRKDSVKYGFHVGFEGGYADTLVIDCPIFTKRLVVEESSTVFDDEYCGHVVISRLKLESKVVVEQLN